MSQLLELSQIQCRGSARQLGEEHGEQLREQIQAFVAQRLEAAEAYMAERGRGSIAELLATAGVCLGIAERWDPAAIAEHGGIAAAARIDPARLYAATNMTDIRDVLLLPGSRGDEGCSVALVPPRLARQRSGIAAQTWDLNPGDLDYVVAIHRQPYGGTQTWSITCVGSLSLMGMNEHGIAVGTTNIKTRGSKPGAGYLSLLHRAIRAPNRYEGIAAIESAPRAAGHTYWVADASGATELECSATRCTLRDGNTMPITRTNHCLALDTEQGEPTPSTSHRRLMRLKDALSREDQTPQSLQALFADRSDGVDSINRYPEDDQGTSTNACVICLPAERRILACRGSADRGRWVELVFA